MMIHGSCIPLDGGGFVVTVICPNHFSYQRLLQVLNEITPDAGEPVEQPKTIPPEPPPVVTELIRRAEQDDGESLGLKAGEAYNQADES